MDEIGSHGGGGKGVNSKQDEGAHSLPSSLCWIIEWMIFNGGLLNCITIFILIKIPNPSSFT